MVVFDSNNLHRRSEFHRTVRMTVFTVALICWLVLGSPAAAQAVEQEAAEEVVEDQAPVDLALDEDTDAESLAKAAQNPLASMISLPLQANWNSGVGEYDRQIFNLNIQPVIPIPGEKWNIITRTIIPVNSVPIGETDSIFGIGDTSLSIFWSPAKASSLTWGIGPAFSLPTASNPEVLGSGKWSIGPTGVLFYGVGNWTMGAVASNVWSVAGESNRGDVNFFFAQWFLNYNFGRGLALGTVPIITCDWEADYGDGDQCTVPLGLQISKVTHFGEQAVNLLLGYYENVMHPEGAADSQVRIQVNFMFPQ